MWVSIIMCVLYWIYSSVQWWVSDIMHHESVWSHASQFNILRVRKIRFEREISQVINIIYSVICSNYNLEEARNAAVLQQQETTALYWNHRGFKFNNHKTMKSDHSAATDSTQTPIKSAVFSEDEGWWRLDYEEHLFSSVEDVDE